MTVLNDVSYGTHERNIVDIYIPDNPKTREGVVLIIHGGGWKTGDKSIHSADAQRLCSLGYISAAMNYRFVSESINISDELSDITAALQRIKEVCAQYGCNLTKVMLTGGSAGAHLSMLYAYTMTNKSPLEIVALFCSCPPVDCAAPDFLIGINGEFENWKYEVLSDCCSMKITKRNFMSPESQGALKNISPLKYISNSSVPIAVCQGKKDEIVPYNQVVSFVNRLKGMEVTCDLIIYENSGHALGMDPEAAEKANELMNEYIRLYLEKRR
ncbi:MAG: alpha/beta hydrolase [Clostridiales bacterium]|nr:alpha/beta hydrolase [Clostridiales bacterium]